ncbi:hypothetical protein EK21DRAFT_73509, partial [Setomelanomma holmii]
MPFLKLKTMDTSRLHNSDMKKLVRILRGLPPSQLFRHEAYVKELHEAIKDLPRNLRQSSLSSWSTLCNIHKGLDSNLLEDIWSWVMYEFERGVGRLIYPLLMGQMLTFAEEMKIRQLEPVFQMWRTDFKPESSAPPGRIPILKGGDIWAHQKDDCAACLLARIGSDEDVLLALFAGMVGRFPTHKTTGRRTDAAELRVAHLESPKSKRIRLLRYWLKSSRGSDTLFYEAAELGIKLKNL